MQLFTQYLRGLDAYFVHILVFGSRFEAKNELAGSFFSQNSLQM